jgi:hypothetical protein
MSFDARSHVFYNIANAQVREYPFPHFYVNPVFPADFYAELRRRLPATSVYQPLHETGTVDQGSYAERYVCDLEAAEEDEFSRGAGDFWEQINAWLGGDEFARLIMHKFGSGIAARYGRDVRFGLESELRLVRDFTNYAIPPHTDKPAKLVSLLFYLPGDDSMRHLGTSIYAPRDPGFRCEGRVHHGFEQFVKVATMEYLPNSLFAFVKNDAAFHGVEPIADAAVERDLLLYNLHVKSVATGKAVPTSESWPVRPAPAWPWQTERA